MANSLLTLLVSSFFILETISCQHCIFHVTLLKQGSGLKTWRSYFLIHLIIISTSAEAAVVEGKRKERSLALPKQLCCVKVPRMADERCIPHPTTNRSCEGTSHVQPRPHQHAWASNTSLRGSGQTYIIVVRIKISLLKVEMIFQRLGARMSFQAKESSNPKLHNPFKQASSAECLVSAARPTEQKPVKSLDNLLLRSEDIHPFLLKIKQKFFILNFNQKTNTFHRKFCLLRFFFPELCQYQNRSHQPYLKCQLVPPKIQFKEASTPFPLPLLKSAGNPSAILSLIYCPG